MARLVSSPRALPRGAVLLDPLSMRALSPQDAWAIDRFGLALVDVSWEHVRSVVPKVKNRHRRALPFLQAGNPVKQDQVGTLSTAEAAAAALYIAGHREQALSILSAFGWGKHFLELNEALLERYSHCKDSSDVVRVQEAELERRWRGTRNPPSVLDGI